MQPHSSPLDPAQMPLVCHLEASDDTFDSQPNIPGGLLVNVNADGVLPSEDQVQQGLEDANVLVHQNGEGQSRRRGPKRHLCRKC